METLLPSTSSPKTRGSNKSRTIAQTATASMNRRARSTARGFLVKRLKPIQTEQIATTRSSAKVHVAQRETLRSKLPQRVATLRFPKAAASSSTLERTSESGAVLPDAL